VTDHRMKDRVKGLLAVPGPDDEPAEQADPAAGFPADADGQRQALQVLTLAQRTAEEHVAGAQQHAARIQAVARAKAEQIIGDAQARAEETRQQAESTLLEARATAVRITREAHGEAEETRRTAERVLAAAREQAAQLAGEARAHAEDLKRRAQQRYDDVVGSLSAKRAALQHQIEALERFDHDYRARLIRFMQVQMRALWVDEAQVSGEVEQPVPVASSAGSPPALQAGAPAPTATDTDTERLPALRSGAVATAAALPAQRSPARQA
jgi:cell division septum initiation protein DivIVA